MKEVKWSLDEMFENDEQIESSLSEINLNTKKIKELKKNPEENIKEILLLSSATFRKLIHVAVFANSKKDENSNITKYQKLSMDVSTVATVFSSTISFINPFILSLSKEEVDKLLNDEELADFHNNIKKTLRYKPHTLSEREEYIISSYNNSFEAPSNIYYYLTTADIKPLKLETLEGVQLSDTNFTLIQQNKDVQVRKESFEKYYGTYNSYRNTISNTLYSNMETKENTAKLKNYDSYRHMALFEDDVDVKVYDALIESIHKYLPVLHKYYALKKELLNLEEQHMYDVYLPIIKDYDKKYTWEDAKKLAIASVKPLGEDYVEVYKSAFDDNWVDVYPRKGKRGGAYSTGSYDSNPYVLMNFNGNLDSVFTLAHEMGHSMHSYYAKHSNTFENYDYTIFAAEVASTFNENLLLDYLKKRISSDEERLYLLDFHLDSFKSTVFRQTMFAEFEKISHNEIANGNSLTADDYDKIYYDLNVKYFGDAMISDKEIAHEWMRIPHFYSDFYVYKYATGYCAATILSKKVLLGVEGARDNYEKFLRDGSKHFPIEQLKIAGIDMTDSKTIDEALEVFKGLVDELEEIVKTNKNK